MAGRSSDRSASQFSPSCSHAGASDDLQQGRDAGGRRLDGQERLLVNALRSQRLQQASGIGLITATAVSASMGDLERFRSGRHFASALGLTPREHSSGNSRRLGRITKRGDTYLRTLLIHGARAALRSARTAQAKDRPLDRTQAWALALSERLGHNKAAVALANKTARRLWAAEHHRRSFDPNHVSQPVDIQAR